MSKIGRQPITIRDKVTVNVSGHVVAVVGPKGTMQVPLPREIEVKQVADELIVKPHGTSKYVQALWGLCRSLLANAVIGVTDGFERSLELVGVGYKVQKKGDGIVLDVGYSHQVEFMPPADVKVEIDASVIKISGVDKQKVGQAAAKIRAIRPPEPYKGKGVRYVGEVIKLKAGKAAKAVGGAA